MLIAFILILSHSFTYRFLFILILNMISPIINVSLHLLQLYSTSAKKWIMNSFIGDTVLSITYISSGIWVSKELL